MSDTPKSQYLIEPWLQRYSVVLSERGEGKSYREIAKIINTTPANATRIGNRAAHARKEGLV